MIKSSDILISNILKLNPQLAKFASNADSLARCSTLICQILNNSNIKFQVTSLEGTTLNVATNLPEWRYKLSLKQLQILNFLNKQGFPKLSKIEIRVIPELFYQKITPERKTRRRELSQKCSKNIIEIANSISNPKLAAVMHKIVKNSQITEDD